MKAAGEARSEREIRDEKGRESTLVEVVRGKELVNEEGKSLAELL